MDEVRESIFHRLELLKLLVQEIQMLLGESLHLATWARPILPEANQTSDFLNRKSQVTGTSDKLQSSDVLLAVHAIPGIGSIGWRQ